MRHLAIIGAAFLACAWAGAACAAVPVRDAALLNKKSDTAATVASLAPVQDQSRTLRRGVHCSVTTGRRASVENPIRQGDVGAAIRSLNGVTGGAPTPVGSSEAAYYGSKLLYDLTGSIMADVDGGQQSVSAGSRAYEQLGGSIGSTDTINEAFDQNSEIRTQTGLAVNSAINTLNQLVQAMNLVNTTTILDQSRASGGLGGYTELTDGSGSRAGRCPVGMTGEGTTGSPCVRSGSACVVSRTVVDPSSGCVVRRTTDSYGNVLIFLTNIVEATPPSGASLSSEELQTMMNQYAQ